MKKIYSIFALMLSVALFSCTNTDELTTTDDGNTGYITLDFSTVGTTYNKGTRTVPVGYDAKTLSVEIVNANGEVVKSTDDATAWAGQEIALMAGKYTVRAHSAGWDGNDSGRDVPYYYGETDVTIRAKVKTDAQIVCTLANVKVTVKFDSSVSKAFKSAVVEVTSSVPGIVKQEFIMGYDGSLNPAYFPVGDLVAKLTITNNDDQQYTLTTPIANVKARDHYILKYSTVQTGNGSFTITADDSETQYTFNFSVPIKASTTLAMGSINPWSNFAWLEGSIPSADITIDDANVRMQYKAAGDTEWTSVSPTKSGDTYKATVTNLNPATVYSVKMVYDDGEHSFASAEKVFETESARALPNGNLDDWCTGKFNSKDCTYPCSAADYSNGNVFWDTSNPGSSLMNKMVTTQETADVHTPGGSAARLGSEYIVIKFAAASLYAGSFGQLKGTSGAVVNFGRAWNDRPTQLKGWFKYSGGAINRNGGAPAGVTITTNSTPDLWSGYVVLADEGYGFDNTDIAGTAWDYETNPRVVAYGAVPDSKCVNASEWTQFTIDLKYHDLSRKPKTIMIVFSSSKYGDYFTGCDKSVLLLDDLELVYGDNPATK